MCWRLFSTTMWKKQNIVLATLCGFLGTVALTLYFSAPFNWMPWPPPNATTKQIFVFGHTSYCPSYRHMAETIGNYLVRHLCFGTRAVCRYFSNVGWQTDLTYIHSYYISKFSRRYICTRRPASGQQQTYRCGINLL